MEFIGVANKELHSLEDSIDPLDASASTVFFRVKYMRAWSYTYIYMYGERRLTKTKEMVYVTNVMTTSKKTRR